MVNLANIAVVSMEDDYSDEGPTKMWGFTGGAVNSYHYCGLNPSSDECNFKE